jgi:Cft2 family RNA processing exonuclease
MSSTSAVQIRFLGGAGQIGASCALVQVAGRSLLIDCGVRFRSANPLPDLDQLTGVALDAIVVTHAHSDHTGALPLAHEAFPEAPIYLTPPTRDLVSVLQRDALKLMHQPGEREADVPLYGERQVEGMLARVHPVHHGESVAVGEVTLTYLPASHILGASMVHLATPAGNLLFTGDYSVTPQRSVPGLPRPLLPVDLVVTESTYGDRLHADRRLAEERLIRTVGEVIERGGRVLIPAFAIGRAQEVILVLREAMRQGKLPRAPLLVDGMVRAVCGVYAQHERYVAPALARQIRSAGHPFFGDTVRPITSPAERRAVASGGAAIIVASSGMLTGGPSAFFAAEFAPNERDAILITGYQDEESPGRALLDLAEARGPRRLVLGGREVEVRCRFEKYSLSAHADRMQMVGLLEALAPRTVVLVHGDAGAKQGLAAGLGAREVILADDGALVERSYPKRIASPSRTHASPLSATPRPPALDARAARGLVGPSSGAALDPSALAFAWFGREVAAPERAAFIASLVSLDAVSRDEKGQLWSTTPGAPDDRAESAGLKEENPKGKLLELAMRRRLPPPELRESTEGAAFVAEWRWSLDGQALTSGPQMASGRKQAEQLAARVLLDRVAAAFPEREARPVSEADALDRRARNPKGKVLELCARFHLPPPRFEREEHLRGVAGRACLSLPEAGDRWTAWYLAPQLNDTEQAAYQEVSDLLWAWKQGSLPATAPGAPPPPAAAAPGALPPGAASGQPPTTPADALPPRFRGEPRGVLNHLRQTGMIGRYEIGLVEQRGPTHQPTFVLSGSVEIAGDQVTSGPIEGRTRREAEAQVAARLVALAAGRLGG